MIEDATENAVREGGSALLLYSGLPEGGIAVAFLLGTYALLDLAPSVPLLLLAFCGTFLVYLGERAVLPAPEDRYNQPGRRAWFRRHRRFVQISGGVALGGIAAALLFLRPATLGAGLGLAGLALLYAAPLLPGGRRLKTIWGLKPLAISGAWAAGGVLLPVVEAGASLSAAVWALAVYRFLFVLPNALWADWPDRTGDRQAGLHTAATRCSRVRLRQVSMGALGMSLVGGVAAVGIGGAPRLLLIDMAGPALLLAALLRPPVSSPRWFYGFLIDALIAWPVVTAVAGGF